MTKVVEGKGKDAPVRSVAIERITEAEVDIHRNASGMVLACLDGYICELLRGKFEVDYKGLEEPITVTRRGKENATTQET